MIIFYLILLFIHYLNGAFTPDKTDYDAYGSKLAINEYFIVKIENENNPPTFLIELAPYNDTSSSFNCSISFPNMTDHYIYTIVPRQNQTQFFFGGELINGKNGTFIGAVKFNNTSLTCDNNFSYFIQYFDNYEHQEYYVIDAASNGRYAYGFSNRFICIFDSQNPSILNSWDGNLTWPDTSFMPHSVKLTENFGIIAGFILNPMDTIAKYIPIVYLINFNLSNNHPIIVDEYKPIANPGTWQDLLTNSDANIYSSKYDMSISINKNGNILVGMQFINRVFLFSVNLTKSNQLNYISRYTGGRSLGNGKGVAWLDNGIAAILINTYSLNYEWSSSQIFLFDIENNGYNSDSKPLSIFPNNHQLLPISFDRIFLNIISLSSSSLALINKVGDILILNPTPPGYYAFVEDIGSMPIFTSPKVCLPGTYKNQTGIHDCILCPPGTKNSGNSSLQCIPCSSKSFCSLGSVSDVPQSLLKSTKQVRAYPSSPESTIFDEILLQNMFNIGSGHCLVVSPLFWTLIVGCLALTMIIIMGILKVLINHSQSKKIRHRLKWIFKRIDLIGEGEFWIGGLLSCCVIVLVSFAYSFSDNYFKQYPIEKTSDSNFACDLSIRNAKFQSNLQSISIPVEEEAEEIFDLLDGQIIFLNIDFINTLINCDVISLQALFGTEWAPIRWTNCTNTNSILSLSIQLPYQHISVEIILDSVQTIGALRIGFYAKGHEDERYNLKELNYFQSFSKSEQLLAQNLPVTFQITRVVNQTELMGGKESIFSGIYLPTYTMDVNSLFSSRDQYVFSKSTLTKLAISISETPYYVKNLQQPIAKRPEIIFHNLLFTSVCLEIFGLIYLSYKLILKPLCQFVFPKHFSKKKKHSVNKVNGEIQINNMITAF